MNTGATTKKIIAMALVVGMTAIAGNALAHCDTLDGPVVLDARVALKNADVTPVLKWVPAESEAEIRSAFDATLAVRKKGEDARKLADTWFFETLVRVHRAGEGAPYAGLKPAGSIHDPAVLAADKALETGSVDSLAKAVANKVEQGIRERFAAASETRRHAGHAVDTGRRFVAAYVEYVHYVEGIHRMAGGASHHGHEETHEEGE